jgi:hypothetical protein
LDFEGQLDLLACINIMYGVIEKVGELFFPYSMS